MHGGSDSDTLYGGDGDDLLYSGTEHDDHHGQDGSDRIIFEAVNSSDTWDEIHGFTTESGGDRIDISDILDFAGYQGGIDAITEFVQISESGSHFFLKIDRDGAGTPYALTRSPSC